MTEVFFVRDLEPCQNCNVCGFAMNWGYNFVITVPLAEWIPYFICDLCWLQNRIEVDHD